MMEDRQIATALGASVKMLERPDVSIIMPCLNERESLPHCIANAQLALAMIEEGQGLSGEIIIADNGSIDGSQALAESMGGRIVGVAKRGYGAALIGGCMAARGRFLLMGDADGSYDFTEGVAMIGKLQEGADLCLGSRFQGGIAPGAMPWKNRYIGNPALTGVLNLLFRSGIDDAHCGLRAITKQAFLDCRLASTGMEFASEMVIKAKLLNKSVEQVPVTLSPDLRDRVPHLRPWRDGWRHLRYMFMLSPTWTFAIPALTMIVAGLVILGLVAGRALGLIAEIPFGESWAVIGGTLVSTGHLALLMALVAHLSGARAGYRAPAKWLFSVRRLFTFEKFLISGLALAAGAVAAIIGLFILWSAHGFRPLATIVPVVYAALVGTVGMQNIFGGFLLAVISEHQADFLSGFEPILGRQEPTGRAGKLFRKIPGYTIAAIFCAFVHNAIMIGLDSLGVHFAIAQMASAAVLLPLGYWLMARAVFDTQCSWSGFQRYSLALLSNYPVQFVLLWILRDRLALPMTISAPVSTVFLYFWNYGTSWLSLASNAFTR